VFIFAHLCADSALQHYFLPRDAMLARYMLASCVRPSVRPFVTSRYCIKTTICRIKKITPYISSGTLVFFAAKNLGEIPMGSPPTGAPNRGGACPNSEFRQICGYISIKSNLFAISSVHSITIHKFASRLAGQTGDNFALMSAHMYISETVQNKDRVTMKR